jgi:hypothetical protein
LKEDEEIDEDKATIFTSTKTALKLMRSYTAAGQINDKAVMRRGATIKRA